MTDTVEKLAEQIYKANPVMVEGHALDWKEFARSKPECANIYRFQARKEVLRDELERCAQARKTITYSEAAALVELANYALSPVLNEIKAEEIKRGWPDLSCLVVNGTTNFPRDVGSCQREQDAAMSLREAVFREHTSNLIAS